MKETTIHIKDRETIKKLKQIQLDQDLKSIEATILYLIDQHEKK